MPEGRTLAGWLQELLVGQEHDLSREDVVYLAESDPACLHVVVAGFVREVRTTPEGKEVVVGIYGPGDVFGDMPSFYGGAASVSAFAVTDAVVWRPSTSGWDALLESDLEARRLLLDYAVARGGAARAMMVLLSRYKTEVRVETLLRALAVKFGEPSPNGNAFEIRVPLTHRLISEMVGASREKVTRAIGRLVERKIVEARRGHRFAILG